MKPRVLCLHSSGGSSETLRRQLKSSMLWASLNEALDLEFLEGPIIMDPQVPGAKMLRMFFPDCANRSFIELVRHCLSRNQRGIHTHIICLNINIFKSPFSKFSCDGNFHCGLPASLLNTPFSFLFWLSPREFNVCLLSG